MGKLSKTLTPIALATAVVIHPLVQPMVAQANSQNIKEFNDVKSNFWAYKEIMDMREQGIINGYDDNTFRPNEAIRRDHVAVLLARSLKLPVVEPAEKFKDVPDNYMYADEIRKVQQANIFDGTDGKFRPNEYLTRAQMAKVLTRAFNLQKKANYDFPDTDSHWAKEYVRALYSNGITFGSDGYFKPEEKVTRAQYATFLYRALNMDPDFKPVPIPNDPTPVTQLETVVEENKDLFIDEKPLNMVAFKNNPIAEKILLEGMDAVRQSGLKFYTGFDSYDSAFTLKSEGYQNPTPRLGDMEFSFVGDGDREADIKYDFRSDRANYLAKEWLKIGFPELAELIPHIDAKVQEGRQYEQSGEYFPGNRERFTIGDYEVQMGVDGFFEFMSIEINYLGN